MQDKTVGKATSYNCIMRPCPIRGENSGEEPPDKSDICHSHHANAPQQRRNLIWQSICNNVLVDRLITCAALITNLCIFNGNWTKKYYVGYDMGRK
jgi:ABC-type nickel/cobalt efflux system permease component RcnA